MTLILRELRAPNALGAVQGFPTAVEAVCHLCDHVLTAPECHGWNLVLGGWDELFDQADQRWKYARQATTSDGASAQELYDDYCCAAQRSMDESSATNWWVVDGDTLATFSTNGVLVVAHLMSEPTIATIFLPGQGHGVLVGRGDSRGTTPLPRECRRRMRSGQHRIGRPDRADSAEWGREERLFFRVFRPAVQFIKRCHFDAMDYQLRRRKHEYALLKKKLPATNGMTFEWWQALREEGGRDGA